MSRCFVIFGLFVLTKAFAGDVAVNTKVQKYGEYQPDYQPFHKEAEAFQAYSKLLTESRQQATDRSYYEKRLKILKQVLNKHPTWLDGYWLAASEAFQMGSSLSDPKDHRQALNFFDEGEELARKCLVQKPDHIFCQMFVASNLAGASAIRGIVSSLRYTVEIHALWQAVATADINYQLTPEVSLQGSVHYALGLFNRLIPDSRLMQWFFGVRGSLSRSIEYHQLNMAIDGPTPCGQLMLAAALLCADEKKQQRPAELNPKGILTASTIYQGFDMNQQICQNTARNLQNQPKLACGLTPAKQQTDEVPGI